MFSTHSLTGPLVLTLLCACGGASPGGEAPAASTPTSDATFAAQADRGGALYGQHCASCHGPGGAGKGDAPRLVGLKEGALPLAPPPGSKVRKGTFATVGDVATFAVENMPPSAPRSLPAADYLAILAFDLRANGIVLEQPLDLAQAAKLTIPR